MFLSGAFFLGEIDMEHPKQLNYMDQLCLMKLRGVSGIDLQVIDEQDGDLGRTKRQYLDKQIHTVQMIGYYELKRYAYPFWDENKGRYGNLKFSDLVARYYRDKKLRQNILHAIEDIEIALNAQISYVLGNRYGALGYLDFSKWCQRDSKNPYLNNRYMDKFAISAEQLRFLSSLQFKIRKSSMFDVRNYLETAGKVFPPVWIMINVLTLGDSVHILKLMSKSSKREVAKSFGCNPNELISWMECLNLIRNICCHNGNLIDFRLKTVPVIPEEYRDSLFKRSIKNRDVYTDRIAIVVFIILQLMDSINPKYQFYKLRGSLYSFIDNDADANKYGFKTKRDVKKVK